MADVQRWFHYSWQGLKITNEFTAEIDLKFDENTLVKLRRNSVAYKNFTITDSGISGTEVQRGTATAGITIFNFFPNKSFQVSLPNTFSPNPSYGATNGIKVAMYIGGSTSVNGYAEPVFIFYNPANDGFMTFYNNVSNNSIQSIQLDTDRKMESMNLQNGSSSLNNLTTYSLSGAGANMRGNSIWLSNNYFYYNEFSTNIPIFDTENHAKAYLRDSINLEGLINGGGGEEDPEEAYTEQFKYWYIKNKWGHNTRNSESSANTKKNYRFYPKRKGICFIKHTPTSSEPYDRILYNYSEYDAKYAAWGEDNDEDFVDNPRVTTHFLSKSISFGSSDYYTKFDYETNIPLWNTQEDADDYFNGLKDISEADNYAYISRQDNAILNPDLPGTDIDELTEVGTNGMRFSYGNRLYEITNIELAALMTELFTPANAQSVIEGNKLFGSNTMEAVSGVLYIPLTSLDAVCEMGSLSNIKVGSWESQDAQGRRIIKNDGTIDCGSFFYNRVYQDYRDYEPYNLLFANLPFCGCHQLTISKYIDKTVSVKYNIDITTGGIVCSLFADNIMVDVFEGTCGASRPISATDNNAYINNVVGAITGASSQAQGSIMGLSNAVGAVGKAANVGAVAAGGAALGATLGAGAVGASGIYTAYQIQQAVDNPPQMHRGSLAGNLAYSLNIRPTFLFYTKRTIRPENELSLIGYPSGHGGVVGSFSGFLQCSAFKLANGFTGTERERQDILAIMRNGIYIE